MKKPFILFFILLFPSVFYVILSTGRPKVSHLPYFGGTDTVRTASGEVDTIYYHEIGEFSFINQDGQVFNRDSMRGTICVVNYIFTTCRGICPAMTQNMYTLQERLRKYNDVRILTHTVDPENDTPAVLKDYAQRNGAEPGKWDFLTGEKPELYTMARKSYFLTAMERDSSLGDVIIPKQIIDGDGGDDDFIHSEQFVLVDKLGRIRSQKDGTDFKQVLEMVDDVENLLFHEHKAHK